MKIREKLPSLADLEKKIKAARKPDISPEPTNSASMGLGLRVGIELVAGVAVGGIAGYMLDHWLGTMPLFFIICLLLGSAGGMLNMIRTVSRQTNRLEQKDN